MPAETKDLSLVKQQVTKATSAAEALTIESPEDLQKGSDLLTRIKTVAKMITGYKDPPVKKAYQAYKEIKEHQDQTWDPLLDDCQRAETIIKQKGIDFKKKVDEEARKEEAKRVEEAAEVERKRKAGEITEASANKKLDKIAEKTNEITRVEGKVEGARGGSMTFTKIKKVEIVDASKLPREFLVPDVTAINREAKIRFDAGRPQIPGVTCELVDNIAGSSR